MEGNRLKSYGGCSTFVRGSVNFPNIRRRRKLIYLSVLERRRKKGIKSVSELAIEYE